MKQMQMMYLTTLLIAAVYMPGCNSVEEKNHQANKTAEIVLKLLAAEKTDSLYKNYTTEGFRQANSEESVRKLGKALSMYLGEPEEHSLMEYRLKMCNGNATGEYLYKVQWAKAAGTLKLSLQWLDGAWKIQTLDIQSPVLEGSRKEKPADPVEMIQI